jgi:hypothetical protein
MGSSFRLRSLQLHDSKDLAANYLNSIIYEAAYNKINNLQKKGGGVPPGQRLTSGAARALHCRRDRPFEESILEG